MARLLYSNQFYDDFVAVQLESKQEEIIQAIDMLSDFPEIGSSILSDYLVREYGPHVRKLVVNPFVAIYEYDGEADAVRVLALIHQRAAR